MKNPYLPFQMIIKDIVTETDDGKIKTFSLSFINKEDEASFKYTPGQFSELTVFGKGEAPFGMASSPTQEGILEFTVSREGLLTSALHNMEIGDIVGIRGPLGNGYDPLETLKNKNIVMIGGGFGFSTLRSLTRYILDDTNRGKFGEITVVYGARNPGLLLYREDLKRWGKRTDINLNITVDTGDDDWTGQVGFVPDIVRELAPSSRDAYVIICGPPAMINFTLPVVETFGFPPERTLVSLEMRMKCGVGMCGRCNIGSKYVCGDGPVFSRKQLSDSVSQEY